MKNWLLLCLLLTIFLTPIFLWGGNSTVSIGPEYVRVYLHNLPTEVSKSARFQGNAWGGSGAYEYKVPDGVYFNLNGYYVLGHIDGEGQHRGFSDDRLECRFGYNFSSAYLAAGWQLIPYAGVGFGEIVQTHIPAAVGPHRFITTRTPTYYIPLGAIATYNINKCWQMGAHVKWTPQIDATFETSAIKDARWRLKNKDGWVVELPISYKTAIACTSISATLAPYWRLLTKGKGTLFADRTRESIAEQEYNFIGVKFLLLLSW